MKPLPRLPLAFLLLTGCAASPSPEETLAESVRRLNCGLAAAAPWRISRPGSDRTPVRSGDAIRACAPPTATEIEYACKGVEGVPIPGSQNPDNPDEPSYAFPDHKVKAARCAFTDAGASRAACRFKMATGAAAPAPMRAELTYRYRDLSNNVVHGWHVANWEVDSICRPGAGAGGLGSRR